MKKVSILIFIIILLLVCSCDDKQKSNNIKIDIQNKELFFIKKYIHEDTVFIKYKNNSDRKKALNILTWKMTNQSNENYLFIINEDDLFSNPFTKTEEEFLFEVTDKNNKITKLSMPLSHFLGGGSQTGGLYKCQYHNDSIRDYNYMYKGIKVENFYRHELYLNNYFILHPNETRTFKSIVSMPILKEVDYETMSSPIYYNLLHNGDMFKIVYKSDSSLIKRVLQDYQLDELKKNKVKIFDGTIMSNSIYLKAR